MTIHGSGFGAKSKASPVLFDNFESGTVGAQIQNHAATIGAWQTGAGSESPVYSNTVVRDGSRSSKHPFTSSTYNSSLAINLDFTKAYIDYWTYVAPLASGPSGLSRNWKPFRFYGDNDALQGGITTMMGMSSMISYFEPTSTVWFSSGDWPRQTWVHIQYWLRLNDVGQSNGSFHGRFDNNDVAKANLQMRSSTAEVMDQVRIGHYWATDSVPEWPYTNTGANVYVDTVYFDTSWARVEIGNAATYAASTHREIQLVTSLSNTDVTFQVQRGTLAPGSYWVSVIDENDQVRATQPITL